MACPLTQRKKPRLSCGHSVKERRGFDDERRGIYAVISCVGLKQFPLFTWIKRRNHRSVGQCGAIGGCGGFGGNGRVGARGKA